MKFKLHEMAVVLLSLAGSSALVQSAHAQFTDASRDLILTFREPGGLSVFEVDVGQASIYYSATSGTSIPITAYSATSQLIPLFGGVDGLSWSVGGCVPNAGDSGDPSKPIATLWVTEPRQDPNAQASPPWSRAGVYTQGQADSKINSILDNAATWAATVAPDSGTNTPSAVAIPSGDVYNANGSLGGAGNYLGTFQGDVENTTPFDFDSAGAPSRSDLYELEPGSGEGTYLGYFELSTDGSMTFYGPSPSTLAITAEPLSLLVDAHDGAAFSVTASGTGTLDYQWQFDSTNIAGATSSSFTISNVVQTNLGTYSVIVSNAVTSITSSNATLSMYPFIVAPFTGDVTDWGTNATLSVGAWGTGPLSYQWYDNGVAIQNATNATLSLPSIQFTNAGLYSVVVGSALGSVTNAPAAVVVNVSGVSLGLYPGVTITGTVGYSYIVQSTTNLSDSNSWVNVANVTLTQPVQLWVNTNTDASLPGNPRRYYSVIPGP